jgi:hypothetical protein
LPAEPLAAERHFPEFPEIVRRGRDRSAEIRALRLLETT